MKVDVVLLPAHLQRQHLLGRAVVVFDVLRATTTMAAALAAGVREIRIFGSLDDARAAARAAARGTGVLCGEVKCLPPPDFDLGNSPGAFTPELHRGKTLYMSTTNGTRAIVAARDAAVVLTGAIVNASAVARALLGRGMDVTLLCAGTDGQEAPEDVLGAGAVLDALLRLDPRAKASDPAMRTHGMFCSSKSDPRDVLTSAQGGRNVIAAGLAPDVDFAARLDSLDVVGVVRREPLSVRRLTEVEPAAPAA